MSRFEIRRDGVTVCASSLERCGYSVKLLRQMLLDGFRYYVDGALVRRPE